MKERPILFSAQMVRALVACTKTQTRRIVKPQPVKTSGTHRGYPLPLMDNDWAWPHPRTSGATMISNRPNGPLGWEIHCPYGQPGDRLWVRETLRAKDGFMVYAADDGRIDCDGLDWPACIEPRKTIVSIHMPRWASRLTLEITGVRVERLQSISKADAIAEGITYSNDFEGFHTEECRHYHGTDPRISYEKLWASINGPGSWAANPWVWVVEFKRIP